MHRRLVFLVPLAGCAMGGAMHQASMTAPSKPPLAPLAIGTRFHPDVSAKISGSATPNLVLYSADPSVLAVEDGALVAKQRGASAVLIATEDGAVVDFQHLWVA